MLIVKRLDKDFKRTHFKNIFLKNKVGIILKVQKKMIRIFSE